MMTHQPNLDCMFTHVLNIDIQVQKGKFHGVIDLGLSVLAFKKHRQRIDIDAEDIVYHVKVCVTHSTGVYNVKVCVKLLN